MSNFFTQTGFIGSSSTVRKAPKIDWEHNRNFSYVEAFDSLRQRCEKRLQTEQRQYYAYPFSYGVRLQDLINKPMGYVQAVIQGRITDALLNDEEIDGVGNFRFNVNGRKIHVMFDINTIYGDMPQTFMGII